MKIAKGRRHDNLRYFTFVYWRFLQLWVSSPTERGAGCPGGCPRSPSSDAPPEILGRSLPGASPWRRQNWNVSDEHDTLVKGKNHTNSTFWCHQDSRRKAWIANTMQWLLQTYQLPEESCSRRLLTL